MSTCIQTDEVCHVLYVTIRMSQFAFHNLYVTICTSQLVCHDSFKVYNEKKKAAEQQLDIAKEMCEKLKKKRLSLVGAFVSTHSGSIVDVDRFDNLLWL